VGAAWVRGGGRARRLEPCPFIVVDVVFAYRRSVARRQLERRLGVGTR
jgi:hypothetical protein